MKLADRHHLTAAVIGKDGRTSAIQRYLEASPRIRGPVRPLVQGKPPDRLTMIEAVQMGAQQIGPDFVVIGPEEPLEYGVVDELQRMGIPCVGPVQALARLESSKAFTRNLLETAQIVGNPEHRVFSDTRGIAQYLKDLGEFVIKPDGLTGGKGVKVSGDHLDSIEAGVAYCEELFRAGQLRIVVEEKLDGEEFSLQSVCDGTHCFHSVPVQDHKRAFDGDEGPNTGGMGSYSDANGLLPFLSRADLRQAERINEEVLEAIHQKSDAQYKGILFGGFMLTKGGIRLLEYNVRFGDPEALNVLSLLKNDFAEICIGIIDGTLESLDFKRMATVCKYLVPRGYPVERTEGSINLGRLPPESENLKVFHAAIQERPDGHYDLMGSRSLAVVGLGHTLPEAYSYAEAAAARVDGPVRYRRDIGSNELIQRRVDHMQHVQHRVAV